MASRTFSFSRPTAPWSKKDTPCASLPRTRFANSSGKVRLVGCIDEGLTLAESAIESALRKSRFWNGRADDDFNERQRKMLNLLLDGFEGKLTSGKWAKICKVSADTALTDIKELIGRGIFVQSAAGGRSTNYELVR